MTAVEFLLKWINDNLSESLIPIHIKEQANKMFEQQIIDAWDNAVIDATYGNKYKSFEQYYNSTYGSKGSDNHIVDTNEMVEDTFKVWECCGMEECICKGSDETKQ